MQIYCIFKVETKHMGIKERFIKYLKTKSVGQTAFEESSGLSRGTISQKSGLSANSIEKIAFACPDLNLDWLITGNGSMLKHDTPIQSSAISEEPKKGSIPYYDNLPVSAGQQDLASSGNNEVPSGWINIPGVSAEGLFPVVGCSMKPEINPGDVVGLSAVNRWDIVDPDKIYMIVTNDDRMIKHLATDDDDREILWCISPNYNKFSIRKEEIKFIYRVTFHGRMV